MSGGVDRCILRIQYVLFLFTQLLTFPVHEYCTGIYPMILILEHGSLKS
jgi:hypothetical protein